MSANWSIRRTNQHVHELTLDITKKPTKILAISDLHWDSAHCRLDLLKRDLDEAKKNNYPVLVFGDLFDAMNGKWDRRADPEQFRPEHQGRNYLDLLVSTAATWFDEYRHILALVSYGNHETSIRKYHETDLIQRLVALLRLKGSPVEIGQYWGFVNINVKMGSKKAQICRVYFEHGSGGGGPVTKSLIKNNRTGRNFWADIYFRGHIHSKTIDQHVTLTTDRLGNIKQHHQFFVQLSTYKEEMLVENDGWHAEMGREARPLGGHWIEFEKTPEKNRNFSLRYRPIPTWN